MATYIQNRNQLEEEIVTLLQSGDRDGISKAYTHYGDALYGIITRIIRSEEVAQEVLQDTFLKIWNNAQQYDRKKGRLFTWFANIARNTAIDTIRSARFQREQKTDSLENFVSINEDRSTEVQISDSGLANVINALDEKYRVLIDMVYFQGYSHRELEKKLDMPLGTVKSRLRLAIKALRKQLDSDYVRKLLFVLMIVKLFIDL